MLYSAFILALGVKYNEMVTLMRFHWVLPWQLSMAHAVRLVVWLKHVKYSLSLHTSLLQSHCSVHAMQLLRSSSTAIEHDCTDVLRLQISLLHLLFA